MTDKKRVALLFGGRGFEHSVSVAGAENLISLIDTERYAIFPILITTDGEFALCHTRGDDKGTAAIPISGGFLTEDGRDLPIDCAIPLLHGDFGEDGTVQGLLSTLNIPFVGSQTRASAICLDKAVTKSVAEALGIPTVPWRLITDGCADGITAPAFIKPDCLGSSVGASEARDSGDLSEAIRRAHEVGGGRVLAERLISPLRELECAYFSAQGEEIFTNAGEILCDGFYSYERKYSERSARTEASAKISGALNEKIRGYASKLCRFIGIRHLARIDFFLSGEDLFFNEINTMPGMTATSLYLRLLEQHGISGSEAVNRLISDAIGGER